MNSGYSFPNSPRPAFDLSIALGIFAVILIKSGYSAIRGQSIMLTIGPFNAGPGRTLEGSSALVFGAILLGLGIVFLALAVIYLFVP